MGKKVLIVDDERNIVDILKFNIKKEGYQVIEAYDGETGLNLAIEKKPDLVLLDIMLPKMDGFTVLKKIREKMAVPVIMLSAKEEEVDKVLGLELGADDYITKPFSPREVLARIKSNIRRIEYGKKPPNPVHIIKAGELSIDTERYEVKRNDKIIELTLREFELVKFLAQHKGQVFTRENLLENVWGYEYFGDVRTVDVTVRRIREKLEEDTSNLKYLMTKRGVGYYFNSID